MFSAAAAPGELYAEPDVLVLAVPAAAVVLGAGGQEEAAGGGSDDDGGKAAILQGASVEEILTAWQPILAL